MSFNRIKQDHFENISYTKKQITDIYNAQTGLTKSEQNLVFVKTDVSFLGVAPLSQSLIVANNEIAFAHKILVGFNTQYRVGFGTFPRQMVNIHSASAGNTNQLDNVLFTELLHDSGGKMMTVYSLFRFV
jgi:hypothetical protein